MHTQYRACPLLADPQTARNRRRGTPLEHLHAAQDRCIVEFGRCSHPLCPSCIGDTVVASADRVLEDHWQLVTYIVDEINTAWETDQQCGTTKNRTMHGYRGPASMRERARRQRPPRRTRRRTGGGYPPRNPGSGIQRLRG